MVITPSGQSRISLGENVRTFREPARQSEISTGVERGRLRGTMALSMSVRIGARTAAEEQRLPDMMRSLQCLAMEMNEGEE